MAKHIIDLSSEIGALSMDDEDDHLEQLRLDNNLRMKINKIKNDYETIFSWNIKQQTGMKKENLILNFIDKIREKCDMITDPENVFNINRFYLKLITSYENYINGDYKGSLLEIENIVKSLETCTFNNSNKEYSDACNHIARATNAYIALTLKLEAEKIMKDVKPITKFNQAENAAICAVKAKVFMEYPPKGNDVALRFADEACKLYSTEPEWTIVWLKAKGRVRRYYNKYKMPEQIEIDAAEVLCAAESKPRLLISVSNLYMEVAFIHKLNNNKNQSDRYYKLSLDLTLKAIELTNDDTKQLYSCLKTYIGFSDKFRSNAIDKVIQKLSNVKNSQVDRVLGKYYLKHGKDYEKAKMYLSRAMSAGHFDSSLQLVKVECLLQPVNTFPLVQTLNMIYDVFINPKWRLIILSQILIYYNYCEYNSKELMRYLKLYLDQDIDNSLKKQHLIFAYPLYKINETFIPKQFLNVLSVKIKNLINYHEWKTEERIVIDDTFDRFNKMSQIKIVGNQFVSDNKYNFHKKNYDRKRYNMKDDKCKWIKQKVTSKIDLTKNDDAPGIAIQNIDENTKNRLKNKKLCLGHEPNNSNNLNLKLDKFKNQHSHIGNLHSVRVENNSTFKNLCFKQNDRDNTKLKWQNRKNKHQNQDDYLLKNRNNSQHTRTYENTKFYLENHRNGTLKNESKIDNQNLSDSGIDIDNRNKYQ